MNTRSFVSLLAVSVVVLSSVGASRPARAADSADECVRFRTSEESTGLALALDNNCDKRLSCVLSWTVACESNGKVTRRWKDQTQLIVAGGTTANRMATTTTCTGDGWRVDDVNWSCSPVK